jgi:hypothetical protein
MPHIVGKDGLIVDAGDGRLVAANADSFRLALGEGTQASIVILRLYHQDWAKDGPVVPLHRLHQFALPAHRAAELGRQLLEYAAQVEKEAHRPKEH